jgi:hypothetical protein
MYPFSDKFKLTILRFEWSKTTLNVENTEIGLCNVITVRLIVYMCLWKAYQLHFQ